MKFLTHTTAIVLVLLMANFNLIQAQSRCIHCGMDIKDQKFKAQARYTSGKTVEFDAIECLINFTKSKDPADFEKLLVTDFYTGRLIDAKNAYYLKSKGLPSPMGAFLSAYEDEDSAKKQKNLLTGDIYRWDQLLKRFADSKFGSVHEHHHHGPGTYAPSGIMGDHLHPKNGLMVSVRHMYMNMDGNRQGSDEVSDDIVYNDYMVAPQQMDMNMLMLGLMYAPSDVVTLMMMQNFAWRDMDLTARMMMGNGMVMLNDFNTYSSFMGDLKLGLLWGIYTGQTTSLHLNSSFNLPTGDIKNRDATPMMANAKLPYAMQLGTGTFDLTIGATFKGVGTKVAYGIQQLNTIRTGENSQGYRFGNTFELNTWFTYEFTKTVSSSIRISGITQGSLNGTDPELNPMMVTTADPENYGGEVIRSGLGFNFLLANNTLILGMELNTPLYRNYNGVQMDEKWGINTSLRYNVL